MILNHYGANQDWDSHNWYAMRRRVADGQFTFHTWDSEFIFINVNDNRIRVRDAAPGQLFERLSKNQEFKIRLADAIQKRMFNDGVLTPDSVVARWNARSSQVEVAIVAETARWGDYRRDVHRAGGPFELIERDVQWVNERDRLLNDYFPQRTGIVIEQYRKLKLFPSIDAPVFSRRDISLNPGSSLELAAAAEATIYYTMDGSDPRLPGGGVSSSALTYTGPIVLSQDARMATRALTTAGEWSAIDSWAFLVGSVPASAQSLRISEIHYNPASPSAAEIGAGFRDNEQFEFVELINILDRTIDLAEVRFEQQTLEGVTIGVGFDFATSPLQQLGPGQRIVIVEDLAAFTTRYGTSVPVAGQWTGGLSNSGERITLTASGKVVHQFSYQDTWYKETDGEGYSLDCINPADDDLTLWGTSGAWQVSATLGGTPGTQTLPTMIPGDSNQDGAFNSSDLVLVFQAGEYEDNEGGNSTFGEGDWNGDGDFTTADLVYAFQKASYSAAARRGSEDFAATLSIDSVLAGNLRGTAVDAVLAEAVADPERRGKKPFIA